MYKAISTGGGWMRQYGTIFFHEDGENLSWGMYRLL
jgi:hypothetical protein